MIMSYNSVLGVPTLNENETTKINPIKTEIIVFVE